MKAVCNCGEPIDGQRILQGFVLEEFERHGHVPLYIILTCDCGDTHVTGPACHMPGKIKDLCDAAWYENHKDCKRRTVRS